MSKEIHTAILRYDDSIKNMIYALQSHYDCDEAEAIYKAIKYAFYEMTYWNR